MAIYHTAQILAISFRYTGGMSYFADIIKNHVRTALQHEGEIQRANQILETVPAKLEQSQAEIRKAVQAAEILGESQTVADMLFGTYPDLDFTQYGLPEPQTTDVDENDVTALDDDVPLPELPEEPVASEVLLYDAEEVIADDPS